MCVRMPNAQHRCTAGGLEDVAAGVGRDPENGMGAGRAARCSRLRCCGKRTLELERVAAAESIDDWAVTESGERIGPVVDRSVDRRRSMEVAGPPMNPRKRMRRRAVCLTATEADVAG